MTVELREYFEALLNEHLRATEIAEREREKAAVSLATELARSIREGDDRLREHVKQQYKQIEAALDAAQREAQLMHNASERAIQKAETATEKRFDGVNAFREQLADQATQFMPREVVDTQMNNVLRRVESNTVMISGALTREAHDVLVREWSAWRATVDQRLAETQGKDAGQAASVAQIMAIIGAVIAVAAILVGAYT